MEIIWYDKICRRLFGATCSMLITYILSCEIRLNELPIHGNIFQNNEIFLKHKYLVFYSSKNIECEYQPKNISCIRDQKKTATTYKKMKSKIQLLQTCILIKTARFLKWLIMKILSVQFYYSFLANTFSKFDLHEFFYNFCLSLVHKRPK